MVAAAGHRQGGQPGPAGVQATPARSAAQATVTAPASIRPTNRVSTSLATTQRAGRRAGSAPGRSGPRRTSCDELSGGSSVSPEHQGQALGRPEGQPEQHDHLGRPPARRSTRRRPASAPPRRPRWPTMQPGRRERTTRRRAAGGGPDRGRGQPQVDAGGSATVDHQPALARASTAPAAQPQQRQPRPPGAARAAPGGAPVATRDRRGQQRRPAGSSSTRARRAPGKNSTGTRNPEQQPEHGEDEHEQRPVVGRPEGGRAEQEPELEADHRGQDQAGRRAGPARQGVGQAQREHQRPPPERGDGAG